jgi:hypothetical protein
MQGVASFVTNKSRIPVNLVTKKGLKTKKAHKDALF